MKIIPSIAAIAFISLFFLLAGCESANEPAPYPELPPRSSFMMDFSDFSNPDDTLGVRETYQHWAHAFTHVTTWNTLISVKLAIPLASFYEAFGHEAEYNPDEENWKWTYGFVVNGQSFTAELTSTSFNDSVLYVMRISKLNGFSDFEWYSGTAAKDRSGGYWILNESPQQPEDILRIDWTYEEENIGNIKYTNTREGSPDFESYIRHGALEADLDRFYDILSTKNNNEVNIQWSNENRYGRIRDPRYFGDDSWNCWNDMLQDVPCP